MMLLNLFKKKEKPILFKQLIVKRKANTDVHIGQIVSIEVEEGESEDKYYLCKYPDTYISNKITKEYKEDCQKYKYAVIKEFNDEKIDARIICCDGYLQRFKIELFYAFENGSAFIIKDENLYDNNKIVGKIIDNRYDSSISITLKELENNVLVSFIRK